MRVLMIPHLQHFRNEESGIKRVVEAYFQSLPQFGVELVGPGESYDLKAIHAGTATDADIAHTHGLYWSADYQADTWEWRANASVIASIRNAKEVTVPSSWVAETFQRDMRYTPHVIGHGIDWDEWANHDEPKGDFVLWNKNRMGDVCDPRPVIELARLFVKGHFVTTFAPKNNRPGNLNVTGVIPHDQMKKMVQSCVVYLATTKETFGIGTLEAMAAGVPILGYAHGGTVDLVEHGVNGYLAEPGNIEDLADGLHYCLAHRRTLGANGREMARAYTWERVCEQVAGVYRLAMKPEPATVAIIIPSYNYADKVGRAIESATKQVYNGLADIVVVDDGSTDGGETRRVVSEWTQRDNRVRYVHQNNAGVANARNRGVAEVSTKYACCLDADDAIAPNFIGACVAELEADRSLGIAYSGLYYTRPDGAEGFSQWPGKYNFDGFLGNPPLNQIPTCCVFRRKMWKRLGGYRQRYAPEGAGEEDAEFWLRCGAYGWNAKLIEPFEEFLQLLNNLRKGLGHEPTRQDVVNHGVSGDWYDNAMSRSFLYSWLSGRVSGAKDHAITDYRGWHPWVKDGQHPFASMATPGRLSHPVRQYDEPVVSVIIPVGPGHEKEVINALDSLEAQTFRKWEAIVVWDTPTITDQANVYKSDLITQSYPYVRQFYTAIERDTGSAGLGAGVARNVGAEKARAPFLLFLDADDHLYPETIEKMVQMWNAHEAAVYTDYVGKAYLGDAAELAPDLRERIRYYNEKSGEAVIGYRAFDYDCQRAQSQPVGDGGKPYVWCNITTLVPKAWHHEIGGFDENMPSWEDWDYWLRMARAGKCFVRIPEELLVYRFYTGGRREIGKGIHAELVEYLRNKYMEVDTKMCDGCGSKGAAPGPRQVMSPIQSPVAARSVVGPVASLVDSDWIPCLYNHPNKGNHRVLGATVFDRQIDGVQMWGYGSGYKINYGYRGGGAKFLVHRLDIEKAPHLFVREQVTPKPPQVQGAPLEAPPQLVDPDEYDEPEPVRHTKPPKAIVTKDEFGLQTLPGISSDIAEQLRADQVFTRQDVLGLGVDGLMEYRGIGKKRAQMIMGALEQISR